MAKYYVEYHRRDMDDAIVEETALQDYCDSEGQNLEHVREVLMSLPRVEYYIKVENGTTIGSFFLIANLDMHHGQVAIMAANWVSRSWRGDREIQKLILWYVKRFCQTFGLRKYQRSKHVSDSIQIQITKEV